MSSNTCMRRQLALKAFIAVFGLGCAEPEHNEQDFVPVAASVRAPKISDSWTIYLDMSLSPGSAREVVVAAEAWQRAVAARCPVRLSFEIGRADVSRDMRGIVVQMGEPDPGALGSAHERVVTLRPSDRFATAARHELGHAFGIDHQPTGIMQESTTVDAIEEPDVNAFVAKRCPPIPESESRSK